MTGAEIIAGVGIAVAAGTAVQQTRSASKSRAAAAKKARKDKAEANRDRQSALEDEQRLTQISERQLSSRATNRGRNLLRFNETLGGTG